MPILSFISDENLRHATQRLVDAALSSQRKVEKNPYRNVIDPFSALVDAARQGISTEEWLTQEKSRQIQKALQNALGAFHQTVLGAMPGWEDAGAGGSYDVRNKELKVIAEIKNKHNTMNARSALSVYDSLSRHLDYSEDNITKAYLVEIIPKQAKAYEVPFAPSERGTSRPTRKDIMRIDGASFYNIAAGEDDALRKLYEALPVVLGDILGVSASELTKSTTFTELFDRVYKV